MSAWKREELWVPRREREFLFGGFESARGEGDGGREANSFSLAFEFPVWFH
jgi:hypothetical protein